MKKLTLSSMSLLVGLSTAFAEPEVSGPPAELENYLATKARTVFLTGEAKVQVPVERAIATLRVVSENRSLSDAIHQNRELRHRLTAQLQKAGVAGTNISSSRFSSSPNYGMFGEKAKSYRIENLVQVTVKDDQEFQWVAAAVDGSPEVHFQGIEAQPGDVELHKVTALQRALANAQKRREAIEATLGIKLQPRGVQNSDLGAPRPVANYGSGSSRAYASKDSISSVTESRSGATATVGEGGGLGEITVNASVTVIYSAEAK